MADIERMTVVFPEPMAAGLRAAVEAGEYATTSEAVRDAVRLWEMRQKLRAEDVARLRVAVEEGRASGPPVPYDGDEMLAEIKRRNPDVLKRHG